MQVCKVCAAKLVQWPIKYYSYTKRAVILRSLILSLYSTGEKMEHERE